MVSALEGVTVLDITDGPAGALATMFLCDNGASVVRIEVPGFNDSRDGPCYPVWDRGKDLVSLDPLADADVLAKMIGRADVLVESFPPSSGFQDAIKQAARSAENAGLVHCSITAYGLNGPLKDHPAMDDLVMARMGILDAQPGFREGPVHVVHPAPSVGAGLLAAQGVVASLFARERTGAGRRVETSLMAGALLFAPKMVGEKMRVRPVQNVPAGGGPFYSVFECADGEFIQLGCIHAGFVDLAAAVMDIAHVMADPKYGDGRYPGTEQARAELFDIVAAAIKTRPYAEWAEIFESADVPYGRACTSDEAFDNPQVRHNEMVVELDDPELGTTRQMGLPIKLSRTPGRIKGPRAVESRTPDEVLAGLESSPSHGATSPMPSDPLAPPLQGVRVLEMTNVIAGPTAGKLLADLGADVIKMESLNGDISRPSGYTYFQFLNANKRSLSVNTQTPEGKEVARAVAATADVVLANMRPGAVDRMGLSEQELSTINPGLIQAHVTAFGWDGPWAHRPGVDPLAQAWMGLQRAQGGEHNPPVFLAQMAPTDYSAGAMGTLGAVMALYARERGGMAQRVDTNLLNSGAVMSLDGFLQYDGKPPRRLADKHQYGLDALHRLYETGDGWIYLAAEGRAEVLGKLLGLELGDAAGEPGPDTGAGSGQGIAEMLSAAFKGDAAGTWVSKLLRAGVPCAMVAENYNLGYFDDPDISADENFEVKHSEFGLMRFFKNGLRFGGTSDIAARPTALLGEHTREVLAEAGFRDETIDDLYQKGVVLTDGANTGLG